MTQTHHTLGEIPAVRLGGVSKVSSAIGKTGAHNRVEAMRIARDRGWL